ncbi:MAG: hypothetical protein EZS28_031489 [Streblomastix strix]|uniref:Uncharacterized protein n=1 Tax=Streblomastix strix TaxID=222440 RepID=A0A5J4URK3_9EUKA|nr:MAG: hypothetical protein EZS28_031489 [Streblomastix strix]
MQAISNADCTPTYDAILAFSIITFIFMSCSLLIALLKVFLPSMTLKLTWTQWFFIVQIATFGSNAVFWLCHFFLPSCGGYKIDWKEIVLFVIAILATVGAVLMVIPKKHPFFVYIYLCFVILHTIFSWLDLWIRDNTYQYWGFACGYHSADYRKNGANLTFEYNVHNLFGSNLQLVCALIVGLNASLKLKN